MNPNLSTQLPNNVERPLDKTARLMYGLGGLAAVATEVYLATNIVRDSETVLSTLAHAAWEVVPLSGVAYLGYVWLKNAISK